MSFGGGGEKGTRKGGDLKKIEEECTYEGKIEDGLKNYY
jgi:hypothetical protein